jgi:predicted ferric reductase
LSYHHSTSRVFLDIIFGVFLLMIVLQILHLLYRNGIFSSRGRPRALVARLANEDKEGQADEEKATRPVSVLVNLSRPMKLDAGQYIYLSLPSLTFWSWLQSHPFTVMSWSNEERDTLELFVQPQRGFTADLLRAAEDGPVSFPAYITGPHGISEPVDQYESVLAIATDFGVAAVIPYFKKLIDNRNRSVARARRLHFVWQVQTRGMMRAIEYDHKANILDIAIAGESLLNSLLEYDEDDTLDKRFVSLLSPEITGRQLIS